MWGVGMHFRDISETGSSARFFVQMIAMYLIAMALGFCLITAAYVWSARDGAEAPARGCSNWGKSFRQELARRSWCAQPMIDADYCRSLQPSSRREISRNRWHSSF
jgi:hypothetical protein